MRFIPITVYTVNVIPDLPLDSCPHSNFFFVSWKTNKKDIEIKMRIQHAVMFLLIVHASLVTAVRSTQSVKEYPPPHCNCSYPVNWTSVSTTSFVNAGFQEASIRAFTIPSVIPSTAREVLLYVVIQVGSTGPHFGWDYVQLYTQEKSVKYTKLLGFATYEQEAWSTNSENMWFPMTTDRQLYVQMFNAYTGHIYFFVSAIGYR